MPDIVIVGAAGLILIILLIMFFKAINDVMDGDL